MTWIDSGISYRIVNSQLRLMWFYFFPGLHLSQVVRKNRWDLYSVHSSLPGVLPRSLLQAHASLPTPSGSAVPFSKGGCVAVGVRWCVVTWSPLRRQFPETPLQALPSPPLWEPLLTSASWTFPGDPLLLAGGHLSAWDASCSQEDCSLLSFWWWIFFSLLVVGNGCFFTSFRTKIVFHDCSLRSLCRFHEKTDSYLTYITNWVRSGNKSAYRSPSSMPTYSDTTVCLSVTHSFYCAGSQNRLVILGQKLYTNEPFH